MNKKHMKHFNKILFAAGLTAVVLGCKEPETPAPNISSNSSAFNANFLFVNASPDAPALSLYVNNLKTGSDAGSDGSYAQGAYNSVPLTSSGASGTLTANTNIRVKAVGGSIGGKLGSNDLIYRAGNNNANNFVAVNGSNYTVFVVDTINRPVPLRTYNSGNFGDLTWFNPKTSTQISVVEKAALTDPAEVANLVSLGVVPLGQSDVGGVRFYVTTDVIPVLASPATQAAIRVVNAVPNTNNTPGNPNLFVRLTRTSGTAGSTPIALASGTTHVMNAANFSPSVGTRTAGSVAFTNQTVAAAGVANVYTLEVSTNNFATTIYSAPNVTFTSGKVYTVFIRGLAGKTGSKGVSHGIVTHN